MKWSKDQILKVLDTCTESFTFPMLDGNGIQRRKGPENFVSVEAFEKYLENNPYNEFDAAFPMSEGDWIDEETADTVVPGRTVLGRDSQIQIPGREEYKALDIELESPDEVFVHEFCRYLASTSRDLVLSTSNELRNLVADEMNLVLTLDDWNDPDIVDPENKPSRNETFQQLADVLATGDVNKYRPTLDPNTHWKNWPEGGTL